MIGYAEIATRLAAHPHAAAAGNPYRDWIVEYAGAAYHGYTMDDPAERMMRDAKLAQIFEGTNQIQRVVIARELLK